MVVWKADELIRSVKLLMLGWKEHSSLEDTHAASRTSSQIRMTSTFGADLNYLIIPTKPNPQPFESSRFGPRVALLQPHPAIQRAN